jgi:hypothetical protein
MRDRDIVGWNAVRGELEVCKVDVMTKKVQESRASNGFYYLVLIYF